MQSIKIFDLDGTVVCSKHRQCTLPDGTLDLDHWRENSTPEKVLKDSSLPMAEWCRQLYADGNRIIACTARVMQACDFQMLSNHGLHFHHVISRPGECNIQDHILKEIQLKTYAQAHGYSWMQFCRLATMYDDANSVIKHMRKIGLVCIDSKMYNLEYLEKSA